MFTVLCLVIQYAFGTPLHRLCYRVSQSNFGCFFVIRRPSRRPSLLVFFLVVFPPSHWLSSLLSLHMIGAGTGPAQVHHLGLYLLRSKGCLLHSRHDVVSSICLFCFVDLKSFLVRKDISTVCLTRSIPCAITLVPVADLIVKEQEL